MTPEREQEIQQRREQASKGPWAGPPGEQTPEEIARDYWLSLEFPVPGAAAQYRDPHPRLTQNFTAALADERAEREEERHDEEVAEKSRQYFVRLANEALQRAEAAEQEGQRLSDVATFQLDRAERLTREVERLRAIERAARDVVAVFVVPSGDDDPASAAWERLEAALTPPALGEGGT